MRILVSVIICFKTAFNFYAVFEGEQIKLYVSLFIATTSWTGTLIKHNQEYSARSVAISAGPDTYTRLTEYNWAVVQWNPLRPNHKKALQATVKTIYF